VKRLERWGLRVGCLLAALTGVGNGALRYFGQRQGEFGLEPHPWQSPLQHAHVLLVPLLVFALGLAARGHVSGMLQHHVQRGRRSGLWLIAFSAPMVVTGYAVQVAVDAQLRLWLAWAHGISSALFVIVYVVHWLKPKARLTAPRARPEMPA
jgi:hypothetical protein